MEGVSEKRILNRHERKEVIESEQVRSEMRKVIEKVRCSEAPGAAEVMMDKTVLAGWQWT